MCCSLVLLHAAERLTADRCAAERSKIRALGMAEAEEARGSTAGGVEGVRERWRREVLLL